MFGLLLVQILQGYCTADIITDLMTNMAEMERRQVLLEKHIVTMEKHMFDIETQYKQEIGELASKITGLCTTFLSITPAQPEVVLWDRDAKAMYSLAKCKQ